MLFSRPAHFARLNVVLELVEAEAIRATQRLEQGREVPENAMVSPPKMISRLGERIRYLPRPVGPCRTDVWHEGVWSRTRKVKLWPAKTFALGWGPVDSEGIGGVVEPR